MSKPGLKTNPDLSHTRPGSNVLTIVLGAAIRDRRIAMHISQDQLAKRSGLHRTYLSDVERGARNPSIKTIEKIAQALQVPVVKLFEERSVSPK